MEILTEDLTLKKALRIKKSLENDDTHWVIHTLVPAALAIGIVCLLLFAMMVISILTSNEGQIPDTKELEEIGMCLTFLGFGIIMGILFSHSDFMGGIRKKIQPMINDAVNRLSEGEDEQDKDDGMCVSDNDVHFDSDNDNRDDGDCRD